MLSATNCTRCGGFIIRETFRDIGVATVGWHCLLCGETVDDVILENRARPSLAVLVGEAPTEWDSSGDETEFGSTGFGYEESVLD